jgi:hypothetical protein
VLESRYKSAALAIGGFLLAASFGTAAPAAPTLSDVDRLKLQNLALAMEVAKLRAEAAQRDYDQARDAARVLLQQLERPGFTFDPSTLTYRPAPAESQP